MFRRSRQRSDGHGAPSPRRQRLFVLVPLLISLAAFILALLTLLAGYKPGFMPETHIVLLDTSGLGRNLLPARRAAVVAAIIDEAKDKTDGVIDDIVDDVTDAIGVDRFYALHAMTVCSGQYAGGGDDSTRGFAVRRCTQPLQELNVIDVIDLDLRVPGRIRSALADLARDAPRIFQAMAGIFIAGALFTGLATLGAVVAAVMAPSRGRLLGTLNVVFLSLAAVTLLCGTLLTTIGGDKLAKVVEDRASRVGLRAVVGARFRGLSWAAFALAVLAALVWIFGLAFVYGKRRRRSRGGDKDAAWS